MGTSGPDGTRPLLTRLRALAHAAGNDGGVQPRRFPNHVCVWMRDAALFKEAAHAKAAVKAETDAAVHAETVWRAVLGNNGVHAACVEQRTAQDKRQTAAVLRTAERVAAAAAAAAPAAPPQLGAPGTPLPSADRLRVLCAVLRRAATTRRPRARASAGGGNACRLRRGVPQIDVRQYDPARGNGSGCSLGGDKA